MSVPCPPAPPLTRSHCSHFLLRCSLRCLPCLAGSRSASRPPRPQSLWPGSRCWRNGSAAACPAWGEGVVSVAPGSSHFHCRSQVSLHPPGLTWLQPDQTAPQVSGQREWAKPCGSRWGQRSLVWSWQEARGSSWRRMQPSLWDHCPRRRSCCWWDWLMWWMPEMTKRCNDYHSATHIQMRTFEVHGNVHYQSKVWNK